MSEPAVTGIQVCFCDLNGRPYDDWDAHDNICLMLDWAAANGKISPLEYLRRVEAATEDLGITREEMDREAGRYTVQDAVDAMIADYLPPYSPLTGRRPARAYSLPPACYRSEYGFLVHIRGACHCGTR